MMRRTAYCVVMLWLVGFVLLGSARAQSNDDAAIDQISRMRDIGAGDQGRIGQWVEREVDALVRKAATNDASVLGAFRAKMSGRFNDSGNTEAFRTQFAIQSTRVAVARFQNPAVRPIAARALATVLGEYQRVETLDGLLAGLPVSDAATRYLCARALTKLASEIGPNAEAFAKTLEALRQAGLAETSPVVLSRIYLALAYPNQVPAVLDAYMQIFDKRLDYRRGPALVVDRAETDAFEFFRTAGVVNALSADQKNQLASRLAVFLRLDALRYSADELTRYEPEALELRMVAAEDVLRTLVGAGKGGDMAGELATGGHARRGDVLNQAHAWVGNAESNQNGALNEAPWNVPVGAP